MYICTSLRMEHLINKSYEEYFGNWSNRTDRFGTHDWNCVNVMEMTML